MQWRRTGSLAIVCLAAISCPRAGGAAEGVDDPVAAELVRLAREYIRLQQEWERLLPDDALDLADESISDEAFLAQLRDVPPSGDDRVLPRFLELAERHPDSPSSLDALAFLVRRRTQSGDTEGTAWKTGEQALDLVMKDHMDNPHVTWIFERVSRAQPTRKSETLLRKALSEGPSRATRAAAAYALARYLQAHGKHHKIVEQLKQKPRLTNFQRALKVFLTPYLERECPYDHEKATAEIERLLDLVDREYADVKAVSWEYSGPLHIIVRPDAAAKPTTYGDLVREMRFELAHLAPGKQAPEIEGADSEGNAFRLSDYRGKVVLLTFSANWCGPCKRLYPTQRRLVEKFQDDDFALLSVSRDEKIDSLKASLASGEITWRCWWDGAEGPIWLSWNPGGTPSIFLIDQRGIIQDVRLNQATPPEEFEQAITALLQRASAEETPNR